MTALTDALRLHSLGCPVDVQTEHGWCRTMCWETGRLHMLLAIHPDRAIRIPEWAMPDWDVIAGRKKVVLPITRPKPAEAADSSTPLTNASGAGFRNGIAELGLEDVLERLATAGCKPMPKGNGEWRSLCPINKLRGHADRRVSVRWVKGIIRGP